MMHVDQAPQLESEERVALGKRFRALFDAEASYMRHSLRRLGVREADLDDAVVDAFLAVNKHLSEYEISRPPRPWLFGFALRIASSQRRLARNRREVFESIEIEDPMRLADEVLAAEQTRQQVLAALDEVDLDRRAVLVLHDLEGHSMPEVTDSLSIPLNTGYSRLRLAREDFAAAMRRIQARRRAA
jgi:RNA polymerase sigma-70 factor (ECF subfamily)